MGYYFNSDCSKAEQKMLDISPNNFGEAKKHKSDKNKCHYHHNRSRVSAMHIISWWC